MILEVRRAPRLTTIDAIRQRLVEILDGERCCGGPYRRVAEVRVTGYRSTVNGGERRIGRDGDDGVGDVGSNDAAAVCGVDVRVGDVEGRGGEDRS